MVTGASEDTEITLGTGKMLALFFGLVILCAVFFGMGFSLGKNASRPMPGDLSPATVATNGSRPSAVRSNGTAPAAQESGSYKTVGQKDPGPQPARDGGTADAAPSASGESQPAPRDPAAAPPPANGYFVQVAAVSKQEDAEALVDALKKKQYPALAASLPTDKLFHVEVGPFADIKDAESMRTKLLGDGYNPILKK
jgi:cell division septation protein DedD